MSGISLEEQRRVVAALQENYIQLSHTFDKILDEQVSSEGRTLREHREEIRRLKEERRMNPEGRGLPPEKEARLNALLYCPRYRSVYIPIASEWFRASLRYSDGREDLKKREEEEACLEAVDEPNTADFSEHKPLLLSQGAYSTGFNISSLGSSVRQRVVSHHLRNNNAGGSGVG